MKRLIGSLATLFFIVAVAPLASFAAPGLGISISFDPSDQTAAESSGSLWVGGEQGSTQTRILRVRSLSDNIRQQISLNFFDQINVDGTLQTDLSKPSRISSWLSYSPERPVVEPGSDVTITITVKIPEDAPDEAYDLTLEVVSGAIVESSGTTSESVGTQAIIGTEIAVQAGFWLGIGDALDLSPNFEILAVDGVLLNGAKSVRIFFENQGIVPVLLAGRFQLSDPAFIDRIFEPVDFEVGTLESGQQTFADVPVPEDVVDGFYRSFVTAQSGGVRKTKLFEGNLVFDDPNKLSIPDLVLRIGLFIIASIGLVMGVRMLRRRKPETPEPPVAPKKAPPKPKAPAAEAKPKTAVKSAAPGKTTPKRPAVKKTASATSKAAVKPAAKPTTKSSTVKKPAGVSKTTTAKSSPAVKKSSVKTMPVKPADSTKKQNTTAKQKVAASKAKSGATTTRKPVAKTSAAKPSQASKTTRKTDPVSPRVRSQSKDTESK